MLLPPINYQLVRSNRKTLAIQVKCAKLIVRAPMHLPETDIHNFIVSKSKWIQSKIAEQQRKEEEKTTLKQGSQLLFLGESYQVVTLNAAPSIYLQNKQLIIASQNSQQAKTLVKDWLYSEAEAHFLERCQYWTETMHLSQKVQSIGLKVTRSKWGHCTVDGRLQFNWLLIMAPPAVIDYVIIHELSHLLHMNHSQYFWQLVSRYCPNYKQHIAWLKDNGHKLAID